MGKSWLVDLEGWGKKEIRSQVEMDILGFAHGARVGSEPGLAGKRTWIISSVLSTSGCR